MSPGRLEEIMTACAPAQVGPLPSVPARKAQAREASQARPPRRPQGVLLHRRPVPSRFADEGTEGWRSLVICLKLLPCNYQNWALSPTGDTENQTTER